MRRDIPNYQWILTEDQSYTLFSEAFGESCHSTTGARSETILHYIKGCEVEAKLHRGPITILEVGFGLGVGLQTTLERLQGHPHEWTFISLEIDRELVNWFIQENDLSGEWKKLEGFDYFQTTLKNCRLIILVGDGRLTLPLFMRNNSLKWNAIYQDAFSPKRNPLLWTMEWFELLKNHATDDVIMSTYSASSSIRKSMMEAGWKISKGDKFGPKRTSTRARLIGESDQDILIHLKNSPVPALKDENVQLFLKGFKNE
jgi:tRNA U34 5-methylaminomethyl-2-thiouridine-forming methyltransferase MnmC